MCGDSVFGAERRDCFTFSAGAPYSLEHTLTARRRPRHEADASNDYMKCIAIAWVSLRPDGPSARVGCCAMNTMAKRCPAVKCVGSSPTSEFPSPRRRLCTPPGERWSIVIEAVTKHPNADGVLALGVTGRLRSRYTPGRAALRQNRLGQCLWHAGSLSERFLSMGKSAHPASVPKTPAANRSSVYL